MTYHSYCNMNILLHFNQKVTVDSAADKKRNDDEQITMSCSGLPHSQVYLLQAPIFELKLSFHNKVHLLIHTGPNCLHNKNIARFIMLSVSLQGHLIPIISVFFPLKANHRDKQKVLVWSSLWLR